jgi:hypothetical protein
MNKLYPDKNINIEFTTANCRIGLQAYVGDLDIGMCETWTLFWMFLVLRTLVYVNKNNIDKLRTSSSSNNNIEAISYVNLIKKIHDDPSVLLINLRPKTGFTHQLRIQCGLNGLPIVGDKIYGNFTLNKLINHKRTNHKKRLYLHSFSIQLTYFIDDKQHEFKYELLKNDEEFKYWN